ncbi:unnamed protein product [Ixodes hexagonus]
MGNVSSALEGNYLKNLRMFVLGSCLPSSCRNEDLEFVLDTVLSKYKMHLEVSSCKTQEQVPLDRPQIAIISIYAFWGLSLLIGSAYELVQYWRARDNRAYSTAPQGQGRRAPHNVRFIAQNSILRELSLQKLPQGMRMILATADDMPLDSLVVLANRTMENSSPTFSAAATLDPPSWEARASNIEAQLERLTSAMPAMGPLRTSSTRSSRRRLSRPTVPTGFAFTGPTLQRPLTIDIGLRRTFRWIFIVPDLRQPFWELIFSLTLACLSTSRPGDSPVTLNSLSSTGSLITLSQLALPSPRTLVDWLTLASQSAQLMKVFHFFLRPMVTNRRRPTRYSTFTTRPTLTPHRSSPG